MNINMKGKNYTLKSIPYFGAMLRNLINESFITIAQKAMGFRYVFT